MNPVGPTLASNRPDGAPDVLVVGAGVFGLWAARHAIRAGKRVLVLEKARVGAGASGGFMGALMPHMPDRWSAKKQFQFEALTSLPEAIAQLEADTGISCGYRRCGRLMPLTHAGMADVVAARSAGAAANWGGRFRLEHLPPGQGPAGWPDERAAPFGLQWDDLSARIDPRGYLSALAAFVRAHGELREGTEVVSIDPARGRVPLADGSAVVAGEIVVANGWEAYRLLQPFMADLAISPGGPIGRGVRGQAVLAEFSHADDLPMLFHDGAYVVPQAGNRVAIGSSSVEDFDPAPDGSAGAFDPGDTAFHARALQLVPALREARIMELWAGIRPRNMLAGRGTEAFMGKVPGHENLAALIGGFKTGLAVGHVAGVTH